MNVPENNVVAMFYSSSSRNTRIPELVSVPELATAAVTARVLVLLVSASLLKPEYLP